MSNKKQSSVDILCQKLANKLGLQAITFYIDHAEEIAEAKAMHKEEIKDAIYWGNIKGYDEHKRIWVLDEDEQYYEETYGGNK
jgi:hypothetical protein